MNLISLENKYKSQPELLPKVDYVLVAFRNKSNELECFIKNLDKLKLIADVMFNVIFNFEYLIDFFLDRQIES